MSDAMVNDFADKATEAFFARLFELVPAGTTGDFPPDATMAFEQAARDAVATIMRNAPTQKYVVAYEVEWAPMKPGDDAPMDRAHSLEYTDERVLDYSMVGIGTAAEVEAALRDLRSAQG